jgi:tetratricopeptide (TPR) repeat protein
MSENESSNRSRATAAGVLLAGLLLATIGAALWYLLRDVPVGVLEAPDVTATAVTKRPPGLSIEYVGSIACRECHSEIWDRYQSHPMAHTLNRVDEFDGVEDYVEDVAFSRGGRTYQVERNGDRVFHHEKQADGDGQVIYDQAVEVNYAIGSGKRGRSYIIDRGGPLFLSPISWYSQKQRWDLSPGYPEVGHQRFERRIVERCIACHAGRVAPDPDWSDRFQNPPILEFGIGCERCHGPGGKHVARQRSGKAAQGDEPIVNPGHLDAALRESVCNQCHLHGEDEVLRYGRTDFDFRPGMHVGEVWSIVVSQTGAHGAESTTAVNQVQQMLSSVCARQSGGRLGCISCHDPHYASSEAEKGAFYRDRCLACHAASDCSESTESRHRPSINDACVACHMPRLQASNVPHTSQTDHRILRHAAPSRRDGEHRGQAAEKSEVFDAVAVRLTELEQSRVQGIRIAHAAERARSRRLARQAAQLLEPVLRAADDDTRAADALAIAWTLTSREKSAIDLWQQQLTIPPVHEETLFSLAVAFQQQGLPGKALEYLDRLLEANPWQARVWRQRSTLLRALGRNDDALGAARQACEVDPSEVDVYRQLADLCREQDLSVEAAHFESVARRLKER